MKRSEKNISIQLLAGIVCLLAAGCEDDGKDAGPRLFKPAGLSVSVSYNNVRATWKATGGADGYEIEASLSETFETGDTVIYTNAATLSAQFTGLRENSPYYFRLRGTADNPQCNSRYIYAQATTLESFTVFYPVDQDSISYSAVTLRLRETVAADKMLVAKTSGNEDSFERAVNATELESRRIRLEGLEAGASYRVTLCNGSQSHGYTTFTLPAVPEGMITIDYSNRDQLQALLDNAAEGATFLFDGALFDYSTTDIILSKAVTLMGEPGVPKPRLYVKNLLMGGRSAAAAVAIGDITLLRIDFSGYRLSGSVEQTSAEPNRYLLSCDFSQSPSVTVRQVNVRDCIVRNYSYSFLELNDRLKENASNKAVIDEINVMRTVAFDLGRNSSGYASFISICSSATNNGYCRQYNIRSSTFHHLLRGMIEARIFDAEHADAGILVEACTFDCLGRRDPAMAGLWYGTDAEATRPMFDFRASGAASAVMVNVNNCIFGELFAEKLSSAFSQGTSSISYGGTFMLAASKLAITSGTLLITGINSTADELFPYRADFNYTVGAAVSPNVKNAGDARWN